MSGSDLPVVLLAEDDPFLRSIVANVIRSSLRYEIVAAASGRDAVDRLCAQKPAVSVALLDFVMPDGNGLEVARRVRAGLPRVPRDLPIIMLTGRNDQALVRVAMELDVNAYIVKPVNRETLFARLDRVRGLPFEPKPAAVYQRVEIPSPWGPERPKRAVPPPATPPAADPAADPAEAPPRVVRIETRVADLAPGDILARPVRGNGGDVILPAHVRLDRALIARLSDLADIAMIPPVVFVIGRQDG